MKIASFISILEHIVSIREVESDAESDWHLMLCNWFGRVQLHVARCGLRVARFSSVFLLSGRAGVAREELWGEEKTVL